MAERERWPLWLPVLLAGGIALYFALPNEPAWYLGPAVAGALACAAWAVRRHGYALLALLALLAMAVGFWAAQDRGTRVAGPIGGRPVWSGLPCGLNSNRSWGSVTGCGCAPC